MMTRVRKWALTFTVFTTLLSPESRAKPGEANAETAVLESGVPASTEESTSGTTRVSVDWSVVSGKSTSRSFSVAIFSAFDPVEAGNATYLENLRYMRLGVFRYHHAGLMSDSKARPQGWIDTEARAWDREKIRKALDGLEGLPGERIINIPEWPEWMDANRDRFLDDDQKQNFAALCADLVRIINVEQKRGFSFEITNELDGLYWLDLKKKGLPERTEELAAIYNACAKAMKEVDPRVRLGGPALTRPDSLENARKFAVLTAENLDFLSFHMYASGSVKDSDRAVFSKTDTMARHVKALREMLTREVPGRNIELHCNEFNISWTWKTKEPRMTNVKGAVFDALALIAMKDAGLDVACAWNERDGVYGKMDSEEKLRSPAHVYHFMNTLMVGDLHPASSSRPIRVRAMAASSGGERTLMLVNWSSEPQEVDLAGAVVGQGSQVKRIELSGDDPVISEWQNTGKMLLPAQSVTWLKS